MSLGCTCTPCISLVQCTTTPSLDLKMDNSSFKTACALRLGSASAIFINASATLRCIPANCMTTAVTRVLEDSPDIHNLTKTALESAHVPMILEPQGVFHSDGKRPERMTIFPWKMGKCISMEYIFHGKCIPFFHGKWENVWCGKCVA